MSVFSFWDSDVTVIVCYSVWVVFKRHMSFDEIQPRWSPMELQSASINVLLVDVHTALYVCCRDMHHGEAAAKVTQKNTLPKFNIAPEKWLLEDYFPFGMVYFQGRTVELPGGRNYMLGSDAPTMQTRKGREGNLHPPRRSIPRYMDRHATWMWHFYWDMFHVHLSTVSGESSSKVP